MWFTGFYEGEGSIAIRPNERTYSISISQNDKNIIFMIKNYFKTGKISFTKLPSGKLHYHLIISNLGETLALAETLQPFIKIHKRKKELETVINFKKSRKIRQYA